MFQLRTEPRYLKIQKLIQAGELGEIVRDELDHDGLVSHRSLLRERRLARDLEG